MDLSLSNQQKDLVTLVKEVVSQEIKPYTASETSADFDWTLIHKLGEHNLVCPTVPKEYGGLGLDSFTTALIIEEIAAAHPGLAAVIAATLHAAEPILLAGSREQKERFLPGLTGKNGGLAAFALTEETGGSDLSSMRTCAVKAPAGFYLNGSKDYVINAEIADFISVIAASSPGQNKASMRVFLVPKNSEGLKIGQRRVTSGLNYAGIFEIIFENTLIEEANVIKGHESGSGYLLVTQTFDRGRAMVGAISVGIARAAYESALDFSEKRVQFGTFIKNHQAIAFSLADMATKIEMARLLTWKACWLIDKGGDYSALSAMAKLAASIIAQQVTCAAADILGARGYERGAPVEQLVRDARVLSTIEGTNNIQRALIASQL